MKFKFSYETLLKHKKRVEEQVQKIYFDAKNKVDESLKLISDMYSSIDQSRDEISRCEGQGGQQVAKITQIHQFISGQNIKIESQRQISRELMKDADEKYQAFVEASKERRALEKLKEKWYLKFKKEQNKKEEKRMNDLIVMRHQRSS